MATRDQINESLLEMMTTTTGRPGGIVDPPSEQPQTPYFIINPAIVGPGKGGMGGSEQEHDFLFDLVCVGKDARQTAWMSSKVHSSIMDRLEGGDYTNQLTLTGHEDQWRICDSRGSISRTGEILWQCIDIYRFRVGLSY